MSEQEQQDETGRALGRLASGVFVITLEDRGRFDGMLATWICQASFHPPMVTAAVNKERSILDSLRTGSRFTVNILGKGNMDIFKNFARPAVDGADRFAGLKLSPEHRHGPVFADAVSYLDCFVEGTADAGDHILVIARVVTGGMLNDTAEPMVHLRKNGFQY